MVNLALGVTTRHDPSSIAATVFPALEMERAGLVIGPRSFSTGEIIYGAKSPGVYAQIDSLDDARSHVRRLKAQGAHSIKNYNQPRREQRQQVVAAALEENMRSVAEGGSLFGLDITLIQDGNTTLEHNIPLSTFYDDVLQFFSKSKTGYTPTLVGLLNLPTEVQDQVRLGQLSLGHAKVLKGVADAERQILLAREAIFKHLSVHALDTLCREAKAEVLHAIYERIVVTGSTIVSIRLTPSAYAHELAVALPDKVALARPTGVGRAITAYEMPIEGRDEWLAAVGGLA